MGYEPTTISLARRLVGRCFDDPLLMRAPYAYQQSTDWDNIIGVQS